MAKNGEDIKGLINDAIEASIKFEELMDSIDFNSYLLKEEVSEVVATTRYKIYENYITKAGDVADNISIKSKNNKILKALFKAKKDRLDARKQTEWKKEEYNYIKAINKLNTALVSIDPNDFKGKVGNNIYKKNHWAKLLLYNEMAICYSGLAESSISLGYAERSISLLKKLHPKIDFSKREELQDRKLLYTFALFNKGEAERLLYNYNQSLKTFQNIIKIYEDKKSWPREKPSDYYSALIRIALILIDLGRGEEAKEYLKKAIFPGRPDYRIQDRDLEKARALIDMKDYEEALRIFDGYQEKEWEYTFTQRKARVNELRLVIEFIRNRAEDFNKSEGDISITINKKFIDFKKTAKELLKECVEKRRDADNFKKTCIRLADYFHELRERSKTPTEIQQNQEMELRCYYLYLCNKIIFEEKKNEAPIEIINDWISKENVNLNSLINTYDNEKIIFSKAIEKINDEHYLKGFFETYVDLCINNEGFLPDSKGHSSINALQKRLIQLFREKDNLTESEKIRELFSIYKEKRNGFRGGVKNKDDSVKFIQGCFFKGNFYSGDNEGNTCLTPDSILNKMRQNTMNFASNVVGKTQRFSQDGKFRGIFTVLRRWNSFTPTLTSSINPSKGGGYFFYFLCNNKPQGIVLDPGYNFLENLLSSGFRIGDINAVVISHAHPDHTDNLPSILSLFHEANSRLGKYHYIRELNKENFNKKHLKLILSQGVFDQYYSGFIKPSQESLKDVIVVKSEGKKPCYNFEFGDKDSHSIEIEAFPTFHGDLMKKWESLGFIINIKKDGKSIRKIGYTSDAHWTKKFSDKFKDCNIICAHLGSIVDILGEKDFCNLCGDYKIDKNTNDKKCKKYDKCEAEKFKNGKPTPNKLLGQAQEQKHLYLSGLTMLFDDLLKSNKMELAIISEFGEELKGGIRMDLYHKFDDWFQSRSKGKAKCIPGDIALEIDLINNNIFCCCCQEFKSKDKISAIPYGKEEAIFFVCDECKSVLSSYQIEKKLNEYYENGRKLELADD